MTPVLHVLAIDPGDTTGWCRFTIPTKSIFGDEPSQILERDYGTFHGDENVQTDAIAEYARKTQSLAYKVGPAIIVEAWDISPHPDSTDPAILSPVRIAARLDYARHKGLLGDCTVTLQSRALAKECMTDRRLHLLHMWVAQDDIRDAHRHGITALRRARENPAFAAQLWPYPAHLLGGKFP